MAWTDNRLWCHPKYVGLSWRAKAVLRHGFEYADGMSTRGKLTAGVLATIGATPAVRRELVQGGWWDENGDGTTIQIHDWDEYNSARDERKAKARERMRTWREKQKGNA